MLKGGVNAEGVETLQIIALSGSDGKVQALDLTIRTQQLLHQELLLLLLRGMTRVAKLGLRWCSTYKSILYWY